MSGHLARALLDDLDADGEALDRLAELLAPHMAAHTATPQAAPSERLLTCAEAAQRTGVHIETIRRAVRSGALRAGRAGRSPRIAPADLDAWLAGADRAAGRTPQPRARRPRTTRKPLATALEALERRDRAQPDTRRGGVAAAETRDDRPVAV